MKNLFDAIKKAEKIAVIPHISPDADAIGSAYGLKDILIKMGKKADVILSNDMPDNLLFLCDEKIYFSPEEKYDYDLVILVDCGDYERMGARSIIFDGARVTVNIDHHRTNKNFADINIINPDAAATAEILYDILTENNVVIDGKAANCLLAGIISDTGGFRHSNTTPHIHDIASDLMENGGSSYLICSELFERKKISQLKVESDAVKNLRFYHGGKTVVSILTAEQLIKAGAKDGDTDAISSILKGIDGVEAAAFLREKDGLVKISMRSSEMVDVSKVCETFKGGGHVRAAGASLEGDINKIAELVVAEVEKQYGI